VIAHIILFEPRADLTDSERAQVLDAFTRATEKVPAVRSVKVGRRVLHGSPGYERAMHQNFEYAAIIEFDDIAGLESYLRHPAHAAAGRHFSESASAALAYDYAFVSAGDAVSLVAKND
jgi:hypothetical protein